MNRPKKKLRYIAFHKPYGVLCQFTGEENDRTLADFGLPKEVYPAGRLDKDSEGLLLLTNDGPFIKKLLEPKFGHERSYLVQVERIPSESDLKQLEKGVVIKGYRTLPCKVRKIIENELEDIEQRDPPIRFRKNVPTCWLEISLTEGKNRQIRRMTAAIGHPTLRLIRIKIGKLQLGPIKQKQWLEITKEEVI
ncbi:MAG: pseudouridine synthase [Bacteriovoracia bacterium]